MAIVFSDNLLFNPSVFGVWLFFLEVQSVYDAHNDFGIRVSVRIFDPLWYIDMDVPKNHAGQTTIASQ